MKNFSWNKYIPYALIGIITLVAIILNIFYIPKYYSQKKKNASTSSYNIIVMGEKEDENIFFTKAFSITKVKTLQDALLTDKDNFGLKYYPSVDSYMVERIKDLTLDTNQYFELRSGDNDSQTASHIDKNCTGTNNSCSVGIGFLNLEKNTDNVYRFVITSF